MNTQFVICKNDHPFAVMPPGTDEKVVISKVEDLQKEQAIPFSVFVWYKEVPVLG